MLLLVACRPDACERLNCQNGGTCIDEACACPDGFTGLECELALDPCLQLTCKNGTCQTNAQGEAACLCDDGFEGTNCADAWTAKFLGNYLATETCNGGGLQFNMEVSNGLKFKQIALGNFNNKRDANNSAKVVANLVSSRAFEIPGQWMHFGFVSGIGSLNEEHTQLTLTFDIIQAGDTLSCSSLLVK